MEKRILLDLQVISALSPGPAPDESVGGGPPMRRKPLQQAPAIALVLGRGFARMLQLTIQPR
jgi:hypothetical protein